MRLSFLKTLAVVTALLGFSAFSYADWVAFNDHVPITGQTHTNATTLKIPSSTNGPVSTNIVMKDITTGTNTPVTLTITRAGNNVFYNQGGAAPVAGTPLYNAFNGYVSFATAPDSMVEINTNSTVTYTFSGLNPSKRYSLIVGANRGSQPVLASNKFTRIEIQGAASFVNAHSSRVITRTQAPADLQTNQVAVNFGTNTVSGDAVDWESIAPSGNTLTVICAQYRGLVPGGSSTGPNGTNCYAITGIRLEELPSGPPVILTQPQDQTVSAGQTASFSVTATGAKPLSYQWYVNGSMISGATNTSYTTPTLGLIDSGSTYSVTVFNSSGSLPSRDAVLTVVSLPVDLIGVTNTVWKYNQTGDNLLTDWKEVVYNDTAWPSGRGVLGWETDNQTVLPLTNTVLSLSNLVTGARITTYYFRTHINIDDPTAVSITASNLIDDGAVIYVNGQEVHRENLPNAPTVIRFDTVATAAIEAAWIGYPIPSSFFVSGDNVIAAEVHNAAATSSDIDFGFRLIGRGLPPTRIAITNNPSDLTVTESAPGTFTVGFSGSQASYQWYKWVNDVPTPIPGATRANYTIPNTAFGDSGYYFVNISNVLGSAASASALLNVIADLSGPTLVLADGTFSPTNITVSFSEQVSPATATNIANYRVSNLGGGGNLTITKAVLDKGTNVILTTSARVSGANYLVVVNNVRDTSSRANVIATDSSIPVTSRVTLVGMEQIGWDFYVPLPFFSPADPGTGWNQLNFQLPNYWASGGQGLFVYDPQDNQYPATKHTDISNGSISSYYRFLFNSTVSPGNAHLFLRHIVDDAIVAYLNGVEIHRFNLTNGVVNTNTPAATNVGIASSVIVEIPATSLRAGTNVLAVELHGTAPPENDADLVFGAELQADVTSYVTGAVMITSGPSDLTVVENQPFQWEFYSVAGSTFQWRTNGTPIPGATNSVFSVASAPGSWNGKLFSVAVSNSLGGVVSTNARLTVITDTTPPALLSAAAASPTSIVAAFSEPMSQLTATNLANYKVTNSVGPNLTVTGASLTNGASNVVLTVSSMSSGAYTLVVNGLKDLASIPNTIPSNSSATVGLQLSIPINTVWRFFTNDVNLGTAWRAVGYNDTASPWSSGPALIADETAALPEPLLTPISRLDNGNYHYTFYFRHHFTMPFGATSVAVTFRHVVDDGCLMYINGQQFHSFNMTNDATNVTYTDQASVNVGDGVYNGPYTTTFSNLVAGDNVIAVEVHQNGTASSDITFGASFDLSIPSVPKGGTLTAPPLQIVKSGTNAIVSWAGTGYTLEKKTVLSSSTFWAPVTNQGPYTASPRTSTNTATFYRLRK